MATITRPVGGVQLLGFEIRVPGRGTFFLDVGDGLTVLYGKNGVGKSTILRALRNLCSGVELSSGEEPMAFAFYQLVEEGTEWAVDLLVHHIPDTQVADTQSLPPMARGSAIPRQTSGRLWWKTHFDSLAPDDRERQVERFVSNTTEMLGQTGLQHLMDTPATFGDESVPLIAVLLANALAAVELEPVRPSADTLSGWPQWFLHYLRQLAAKSLISAEVSEYSEVTEKPIDLEAMRKFHDLLGLDAPDIDANALAAGLVGPHNWDALVHLLIYRCMRRADRLLTDPEHSPPEVLGILREAMTTLRESRIIRIGPNGTPDDPTWEYALCARLKQDPNDGMSILAEGRSDPIQWPLWSPELLTFMGSLGRAANDLFRGEERLLDALHADLERMSEEDRLGLERRPDGTRRTVDEMIAEMRRMVGLAEPDHVTDFRGTDTSATEAETELALPDASESTNSERAIWAEQARQRDCGLFGTGSASPGVVVSRIALTGAGLPFNVCDLTLDFDIHAYMRSMFSSALSDGDLSLTNLVNGPPNAFTTAEFELESEGVQRLCEHLDKVGNDLRRLEIGISGLRLVVVRDVRKWIDEAPFQFEAQDATTLQWVPISALSFAQAKWLGHLLQIHHDLAGPFPLLVIADEPESGVHSSAAKTAFDFLGSLDATSIAASHAPTSLHLSAANLQLVDRDFEGRIVLGNARTSDDVRADAVRLGTTPMDLLGLKRVLVYVEGAHDRAVVEEMLTLSQIADLAERVLVVPALGVANLGGVAGSTIIANYTDLHVLAVADNARTEDLNLVRSQLLDFAAEGVGSAAAFAKVDLPQFEKRTTKEERVLWHLLRSSYERRTLHRIHFFGLSVPDIIDTLPWTSFQLTQDWASLREEHAKYLRSRRDSGKNNDFKSWLRKVKNAQISTRTIRSAFQSLDEIPDELARLLARIEELVVRFADARN